MFLPDLTSRVLTWPHASCSYLASSLVFLPGLTLRVLTLPRASCSYLASHLVFLPGLTHLASLNIGLFKESQIIILIILSYTTTRQVRHAAHYRNEFMTITRQVRRAAHYRNEFMTITRQVRHAAHYRNEFVQWR